MDLVALGHYPRPRSIVDFKLDALERSKFIVVIVRNKKNDDDRYRSQQIDTAYQRNQDDSAVMRQQYDYIYLKGSKKIAATNDVGDDGIVDGSSAITKTMRIRACLIGRQIRIPFSVMVSRHAREFCGSRKS